MYVVITQRGVEKLTQSTPMLNTNWGLILDYGTNCCRTSKQDPESLLFLLDRSFSLRVSPQSI